MRALQTAGAIALLLALWSPWADAEQRVVCQVETPPDTVTVRGGAKIRGAQSPLLVLARHLASDEPRPLLLVWDHGDESASAIVVRPLSRRTLTAAF